MRQILARKEASFRAKEKPGISPKLHAFGFGSDLWLFPVRFARRRAGKAGLPGSDDVDVSR